MLYSEVMPYTMAVLEMLVCKYRCSVTLIFWDKKKLTNYMHSSQSISSFARSTETATSMLYRLETVKPDLMYVSGRMDRDYLKVARRAKKAGIPVVMGSDKQWHATMKDYIAVALRRWLYKPFFTHAWVSGLPQYEYARAVGFKRNNILMDLYAGNVNLFNAFFKKREKTEKKKDVLFVGRLTTVKGVIPFISALADLKREGFFQGNLWLYGDGPLGGEIPEYDWIIRRGFAQQVDLEEGIVNAAIFCLPSIAEPWGVVIHEMAAAGLPICCSDSCGAATAFVKNGYNGLTFISGDWQDLRLKLKVMLTSPGKVQSKMGHRSHQLAQCITPETSAISLLGALGKTEEILTTNK